MKFKSTKRTRIFCWEETERKTKSKLMVTKIMNFRYESGNSEENEKKI